MSRVAPTTTGEPTGVTWNGRVHPVAECFPVLPPSELEDLELDIKTNGLIQPIVVDTEGTLIDGRNRLAACQVAGIEPRFVILDAGVDIETYILSVNIVRRHLSAGQRAMVVVKVRKVCGKPLTTADAADEADVSQSRMKYAAVVLEHGDEELVDVVIAGETSLDSAYYLVRPRPAPPILPGASQNSFYLDDDEDDEPKSRWPSPPPASTQSTSAPDSETTWRDRLIEQVILPIGKVADVCAGWSDEDLTRHPLPTEDLSVAAEALRAAQEEIGRVVDTICGGVQ